ncbi:aspartate--tRNA ligase [Clostridia bacterium]|nr:aspartate--tRNA ligase [Clostridia bacterium]
MVQSRTHTCNALRGSHIDEHVVLVGWFENIRKVSKNLGFLLLRDYYGVTQIVIETEEMMEVVDQFNKESTLCIEGTVRERSSKNKDLPTGEIEVLPEKITLIGKCIHNALPFEIRQSREADEHLRLNYRYLDLRNPQVKEKIILRSRVITALRNKMTELDFLEITTPILTCSSPEGARDYLVPSRNHHGQFYALPQAPQQFKQILMTSGFDRYFQIAPCFRDEDARADRSPGEFYQLDMEMAFASQEDVFYVIEQVLPPIFEQYGLYTQVSPTPFRRISYAESLEKYGTDKPDLRIDLVIQDASSLLSACGFEPFVSQSVKAIVVSDCTLSRKAIDQLCSAVQVQSNQKAYWFKVDDGGELTGGIAKFLGDKKQQIIQELGLKAGDFVGLTSGNHMTALKTAGVFRKMLGQACPSHQKQDAYEFCWIVDFPMYEIGEESGQLEFSHNPFSMPQGGLEVLNQKEPTEILAYQYDLVCNGIELSSGAVRNHDPETMIKAFSLVGLGEKDVKEKFPAMYNAFGYGAPSHAGIAPGVDRMVMLLTGDENIREVIAFPMNKNGVDVMMGAPSFVEDKQLKEVHIQVEKTKETFSQGIDE